MGFTTGFLFASVFIAFSTGFARGFLGISRCKRLKMCQDLGS